MKSNLSISKLNLIANKFCITISDLFSPNYLVGDPYKNLRPQLIILLYIENQLSKKQKEQELIENQIQNENNPENLRKLFEELKSINENIGWLKKSIADFNHE
jgi:spermidine/putrescine-binding protein